MSITEQSFHFITGKGGVGKTTISILLGVYFSQQQQKTLICEIDQREEISHYFKQKKSNGSLVQSSHYLSFVNIAFDRALEEYGLMKLKFKSIYQLFFDHPLAKALISLVPGVEDLVLLGKAFHHHREKNQKGEQIWHKIILDAPATGHANTLLELPRVIKDAVPYGNIHQEAEQMWALLASPQQNMIHLVCLLEELPIQELIEFQERLISKNIEQCTIWINEFDPNTEWQYQALTLPLIGNDLIVGLMMKEVLQRKKRIEMFLKLSQHIQQNPKIKLYFFPKLPSTHLSDFAKQAQNLERFEITPKHLEQAYLYQNQLRSTLQDLEKIHLNKSKPKIDPKPQKQPIQRKLKLILGAGGVGKTTTSIALALEAQKQGLKVALITIDPARRLAQALGLDQIQGELSPLPQYPHIDAMMLDRKYSSDQLVRKCAQSPEQAELILKNKYYQAFSSSLAGTQEYMAIYEINQAVQKNRYDLIIVDTPPSKHAIDFLDTPQKLIQALNQKIIFQMLGKKEGFSAGQLILKSLGKLTAGPFLEELFQFILLFREVLEGLKSNAISLIELLKKNTEVIMVSTLQQESMLLSIELKKQLTERAIPVHALLINRCQKPLLDHEQAFDLALKSCLEENRFWFDLIEQKEKKHQERYLEEKKQLEGLKNHFKTQKIIQLYLKDEDQQTDGFDQELNGFDF